MSDEGSYLWAKGYESAEEHAADEIKRLRAALESLTKDPPSSLDEADEDWEVVLKMRAIARAALDGSDPPRGRPIWVQQADGSYKAGWTTE